MDLILIGLTYWWRVYDRTINAYVFVILSSVNICRSYHIYFCVYYCQCLMFGENKIYAIDSYSSPCMYVPDVFYIQNITVDQRQNFVEICKYGPKNEYDSYQNTCRIVNYIKHPIWQKLSIKTTKNKNKHMITKFASNGGCHNDR